MNPASGEPLKGKRMLVLEDDFDLGMDEKAPPESRRYRRRSSGEFKRAGDIEARVPFKILSTRQAVPTARLMAS